jgi:hypothetical protein
MNLSGSKSKKTTKRKRSDSMNSKSKSNSKSNSKSKKSKSKSPKGKASRKIKSFLLSKRHKIKSLFLQTICADSGFCIDFGIESKNIKTFFNNFITGDFFVSPVTRIGKISKNGFVNLINYEREGYKISTVLKSSTSYDSDNLYYEYLVGDFINEWTQIYPCFLETYGLFVYKGVEYWEYVKNNRSINENILQTHLINFPNITFNNSCKYSKYIAILTQYINNSQTLFEKIFEGKDDMFKFDLVNIMFQIYMPLATLSEQFTHYDLHLQNVLVYTPNENKYIHYHYHMDGYSVDFKSKYIVKIIDYGRAYFNDNNGRDSFDIYKHVCSSEYCGGMKCGIDYGYANLVPERYIGSRNHITSFKPNISHDLRLLHQIGKYYYNIYPKTENENKSLFKLLLEQVVYGTEDQVNKIIYGTIEINRENTEYIYNIIDAYTALSYLLQLNETITANEALYSTFEKIGDLHIYEDMRPMEFIPFI